MYVVKKNMELEPFYWRKQRKWNWNIETQTRPPFPIIKPLCEGRDKVVYGSKYQGNFGCNQCVCMALTAIVVSSTSTPAKSFNGVTIDYILKIGNELYKKVAKKKYPDKTNPLLAVLDVEVIIVGEANPTQTSKPLCITVNMVMDNVAVTSPDKIKQGMKRLQYYIPKDSQKAVRSLLVMHQWLETAFAMTNSWGVIILYDSYAYSIIRYDSRCYFFDSHANKKEKDKTKRNRAMLLEIANSADVIRILLLKRGLSNKELSLHNVVGELPIPISRLSWEKNRQQYMVKPFQPTCEDFSVYSIILQYINDPDALLKSPDASYVDLAYQRSDAGSYSEPAPVRGYIPGECSDDEKEVKKKSTTQNVVQIPQPIQKQNVGEKTKISTSNIATASSSSSPASNTTPTPTPTVDIKNLSFSQLKEMVDECKKAPSHSLTKEDIVLIQTQLLRLVIDNGRADTDKKKMKIVNEFRRYKRQHNIAVLKGVLSNASEELRKQFVKVKTSIPIELFPVLFPDYYIVPWTEPDGTIEAPYVGPLIQHVKSDKLRDIVNTAGIGDYNIVDAKESDLSKYGELDIEVVSAPQSTTGPLYIKKSNVRNNDIQNHHQWVILFLLSYEAVRKYWFVDDYEYKYEDLIRNPYLENDEETLITIDTYKEDDNVVHVIDQLISCSPSRQKIILPDNITTGEGVQKTDKIEDMATNASETPGPSLMDKKDDADKELLNRINIVSENNMQFGLPQCDDDDASKSSLDIISDKETDENVSFIVESFTPLQSDEAIPVKKSTKSSRGSSSPDKKKKKDQKKTPEEPNVQKIRIGGDRLKAKRRVKPRPKVRNAVTLVQKKR